MCQNDKYTPLQFDKDNVTENNYISNGEGLNIINKENNDANVLQVQQNNKQQQVLRPNLHLTELLVTEHA